MLAKYYTFAGVLRMLAFYVCWRYKGLELLSLWLPNLANSVDIAILTPRRGSVSFQVTTVCNSLVVDQLQTIRAGLILKGLFNVASKGYCERVVDTITTRLI